MLDSPPVTSPADSPPASDNTGLPRRRNSAPQPAALAALGVLTHPVRLRIADRLGASPDGLTVKELAGALGDVHHNAVRNHLRVLGRAGIVAVERDPPTGRGRPTERFRLVDPEASRIAAQQELLRLLVAMLVDAGVDHRQARAFGTTHGSVLIGGAEREQIIGSLARLGFAPHDTTAANDAAAGVLGLRLDFCPFADAVCAPGGTIVCALHRGLIEGAVAQSGGGARVTEFHVFDPHTAGCIVRLEGLPRPSSQGSRTAA